jgi:predicted amidohydrolase
MCRIVEKATTEGVRVLVFPELCVDKSGAEEVFQYVARFNTPPALVVIGSYHWSDGAVRRNTCTAFRAGSQRPLEHHKIAPFSFKEKETDLTFREDIQPGDTIRVYVGADWSVVLLICRDFLDASLRPLVEALRPTLLCIPSYSQTTPFVDFVGALTATAQTVIVFANGPVPVDRVAAVFGVPRLRKTPGTGAALARQDVIPEQLPTLPCLVVYDGHADAITRLSCG